MNDTIEKAVKSLGEIRIDNLTSTEEISKYDLYHSDYDPITGLFLCQQNEPHFLNQKGGTRYAQKKSRSNSRRSEKHGL